MTAANNDNVEDYFICLCTVHKAATAKACPLHSEQQGRGDRRGGGGLDVYWELHVQAAESSFKTDFLK